jgi:hypothetical protein
MHVAVGPDGAYVSDGGVPRQVHAGIRDVVDGTVGDESALVAAVGADDRVTALVVDGRPVGDLVGVPAVHGFRSRVVARGGPLADAGNAILLDLPVGVALAGYAQMQSGRQSGRSTAEVIDASALPVLADSCAGWASDGEVMTRIRDGGYRPPRLPPQVPDPDIGAWHDLGGLRPWWVRRRRRIDVMGIDGRLAIGGAFRDSWMDADGVERSLHEWEVDLEVVDDEIVAIGAVARSLPFGVCPQTASRLDRLVGGDVGDLRTSVRERLGGVAGCTHLNDLLGVIPEAVAASRRRGG